MDIHEYQAKQLLKGYGVPILYGVVALKETDINDILNNFDADFYVVKAQIHSGGRGKSGGIKIARNKDEAKKIAHSLINTKLITNQTGPSGQIIRKIYIESGCNIAREYYFSIIIDRIMSSIAFIASTEGGISFEESALKHPRKLIKVFIDPAVGIQSFHCRNIAFGLGLFGNQAKQMISLVESTYNAFISTDALQIEINPLVVTTGGNLFALDVKINFDDNALFRHPELSILRDNNETDNLETRARDFKLNYVRIGGNIGCVVNGAGLAMATMDIIKLYGASPANFLDIGGGADKEKIVEAFKIIMSDPLVKGILVNIFGGIVRCDTIAEGLVIAAKNMKLNIPIVVRFAGTNFKLAQKILISSGLKIFIANSLSDAVTKIVASI